MAILLLLLDQLSKYLAGIYLQKPLSLTPWFSLRFEQNFGIAWSIPVPHTLLLTINFLLLMLLPFFLASHLDLRHLKAQIFLGLLLGGAIGNLFDRLGHGFVVDFIAVGSWPVFNLADAFLTLGIFLILVFYGRIKKV